MLTFFFCSYCYGKAPFHTKPWPCIKYAYVSTTYILPATLDRRAVLLLPCLSISLKDKGNLWKTSDSSWSVQRFQRFLNRKQFSLPHCDRQRELENTVLLFLVLTKKSLRIYILLTLSGVRELKKTSSVSVLFREASRSSGYSEDAFVASNAIRKEDSFFTNGTSSDTTASDLLN